MSLTRIAHPIELDPVEVGCFFTRGAVLVGMGHPEDGLRDLEQANRLDAANTHQTLHPMGLAHLFLGNLETAELMFREGLNHAKDTDVGRAMLVACLDKLRMPKKCGRPL